MSVFAVEDRSLEIAFGVQDVAGIDIEGLRDEQVRFTIEFDGPNGAGFQH